MEQRHHQNPNTRIGLRRDTPDREEQIEGEAKVERREGSRLRPSTAAELAGARRNRPATAKAKRGSRRPREREREERERRVVRSDRTGPG